MCLAEHVLRMGWHWPMCDQQSNALHMIHQTIKLSETPPDHPAVHHSCTYRVIVCPAAIQRILQNCKVSQWHGYSYHTDWSSTQRYYTYLGLLDASPCVLKHERTIPPEAQGTGWETHFEMR